MPAVTMPGVDVPQFLCLSYKFLACRYGICTNYCIHTIREILLNLHGPAKNSNLSFHCFMYYMFLMWLTGDAMGRTSW